MPTNRSCAAAPWRALAAWALIALSPLAAAAQPDDTLVSSAAR
jgi:hypothetical protein